jgi:hypothetical protein
MSNYIDKHGRWHIKPVTETNPYPTNNAYIYSFYASMVGLPVEFDSVISNEVNSLDEKAISRHPGGYHIPISHDEYVGLAGLDVTYAADIVEFGEKNYFQYCDIEGFTPAPFRKLVINDVIEAYEGLANEENPRTAVVKYPAIWSLAFWHRPEQQYFYYRCANRSPGLIRTLYFIIASLFTIFRKEKTTVMLGFKLKKLMRSPKLADRIVNFLMNKFGDFDNQCNLYFPDDHPIKEKL